MVRVLRFRVGAPVSKDVSECVCARAHAWGVLAWNAGDIHTLDGNVKRVTHAGNSPQGGRRVTPATATA